MRIAVLADIHGNHFALEAVLEDIVKQAVDEIVVAGDLVNLFPDPRRTWEILKGLNCQLLQGNHEYYVYIANSPEAPDWMHLERFQPARWAASQFSEAEKADMKALPWHYTQPGLHITHASERSLFDNVVAQTTDEELEAYFPTVRVPLIVRGHNHHWIERVWGQSRILSLNACGLPLADGTDAPYAILTQESNQNWSYEKRTIRYDHAAALSSMDDNYLHNIGALGSIFRLELKYARSHLAPFFNRYLDPLQAGKITLQRAVQQYLVEVA